MALLTPALVSIESILPGVQWSLHQDISIELDNDLIESIDHLGLLRPPIVRPGQDGYELICGARRLDALRQLRHGPTMPCSVLGDQVQGEDFLLVVAEDQIHTGPLSSIEASRLIALHSQCCTQPNHELLMRATSTSSTTQRNRLHSLLQLEEPIRTSIHHGGISTKTGLSLVSLPSAERLFIYELFTRLSLNANKQRRFLELVQIITAAKGCTIAELITDHFAELCQGHIENIPQKTHQLMKHLYELSHPGISLAKEEFLKQVSEINLPKNCKAIPSPAFEKDRITLEVAFDDFNAFSEACNKIRKYG